MTIVGSGSRTFLRAFGQGSPAWTQALGHGDAGAARPGHAEALPAFERENREYFARGGPDRGDACFAQFAALLRSSRPPQARSVR
jgi:hypothetical protein